MIESLRPPGRGPARRVKIHEADAKSLLVAQGLPVPAWEVARTPTQARAAAVRFLADPGNATRKVVIKAQVLVGGRGKAGGVRLAGTADEAEDVAAQILALEIKGLPVRRVLVGPAAEIVKEYYLSVVLDRATKRLMFIGSAEGGVEIEQVAVDNPDAIVYEHADPLLGLPDYAARELAFKIGFGQHWKAGAAIAKGLLRTMLAYDADLVEINPLAVIREHNADGTEVERLVCLDAKITLDDSALARHTELEALRDLDAEDPTDVEARRYDLTFIKLEGDIGCMVNGAGLAMTTMDLVKRAGGRAGELPRHRRRRQGGPGRGRDAADPRRPQRQGDPREHLRRHHPRRRGRAGADRGPGAAGARGADGRPDRGHQRRGGRRAAGGGELRHRGQPRRGGREGRRGGEGGGGVSILIGRDTRLLVQGITGREGEFHSRAMLEYGTPLVAGVTPGKGGQMALDGQVPVFDTVAEAVEATGANTSCIFVPAAGAPDAVLESVAAGIATIFCITEGIPALDMIPVVEEVRLAGARLIGPNCPGRDVARHRRRSGIIPGSIHREGRVGVVSRSGTLTYEAVQAMTDAGLGQSTCVGIGGDPVIGTQFLEILQLFEADPDTDAIVLIGEIGGTAEEEAAAWAAEHLARRPEGGVHRRPHRARGQADGPRGRDRLGRARARRRPRSRRSRRPGSASPGSPTELPALLRDAGYRG